MRLIEKILYEANNPEIIVSQEDEDRFCFEIPDIALAIVERFFDGLWMFEDEITDEEYEEIFPNDNFLKIEHLEVNDKYKGMGYAKLLMKKILQFAKSNNYKQIYLNASPMGSKGLGISDLVGFYKKFGFKTFLDQGNNHLMILNLK